MKTKLTLISAIVIGLIAFALQSFSIKTTDEPWKKEQLMEPSELAAIINKPNAKKPIIYSVGPGADIKGSIEMGAAQEKENFDKFKAALNKLDKNTEIVLLCGCCPFEHCPNIRPAFKLLNEMNFSNHKLLNLPHNLKVDWIDKGFPMNQ
jgi:thiosulfate/3-mercaptopyruvate sulfurtransferase